MKEWILENTKITTDKYDSIINPTTVTIKGVSKDLTKEPLTNHPIININIFTIEPPTESRLKEFNIQKEKDYYTYENIKFNILAELITTLKSTLYSTSRCATCFTISTKICLMQPKSRIITAMCEDIFHKIHEPFLHSFVTITNPHDNQEYVLDGTMNIIINKQEYLNLLKAKIISDISKKELITAINIFSELKIQNEITLLEYLCFPKETLNIAKKIKKRKNTII